MRHHADLDPGHGRIVAGIVFACIGAGFLLESLGVWRVDVVYVWPITLIGIGVSFLLGRARRIRIEEDRSAKLAVAEERVRIARELHDIVAHGVSLMTIQIAAARRVATRRPEAADQALSAAEEAGRQSLAELRSLLAVLRSADASLGEVRLDAGDPFTDAAGAGGGFGRGFGGGDAASREDTLSSGLAEDDAPMAPLPRLADVPDLVDGLRSAGLDVVLEQQGIPPAVSPATELTVYRVVQESLTNVVRHAAGARVTVRLAYAPDSVEVVVEDDGAGATASTPSAGGGAGAGGHGLLGMRERVAAIGGTISAGPRPGSPGWRVAARLPVVVRA